jgi:hypothetical protein
MGVCCLFAWRVVNQQGEEDEILKILTKISNFCFFKNPNGCSDYHVTLVMVCLYVSNFTKNQPVSFRVECEKVDANAAMNHKLCESKIHQS